MVFCCNYYIYICFLTCVLNWNGSNILFWNIIVIFNVLATPLDVVKVRLQAQLKTESMINYFLKIN